MPRAANTLNKNIKTPQKVDPQGSLFIGGHNLQPGLAQATRTSNTPPSWNVPNGQPRPLSGGLVWAEIPGPEPGREPSFYWDKGGGHAPVRLFTTYGKDQKGAWIARASMLQWPLYSGGGVLLLQ